jgi:hypothetical protein
VGILSGDAHCRICNGSVYTVYKFLIAIGVGCYTGYVSVVCLAKVMV